MRAKLETDDQRPEASAENGQSSETHAPGGPLATPPTPEGRAAAEDEGEEA